MLLHPQMAAVPNDNLSQFTRTDSDENPSGFGNYVLIFILCDGMIKICQRKCRRENYEGIYHYDGRYL